MSYFLKAIPIFTKKSKQQNGVEADTFIYERVSSLIS